MKPSLLLFSLLALAPALTVAGESNTQGQTYGELWIAVHVPLVPSSSWVSNDTAITFADLAAKALRSQGFKEKIGTLRPDDTGPARASVLLIQLSMWSARDGTAECAFTASLRTDHGDRELGFFTGDNLIVTGDGKHQISSDGLAGSAQEALTDLYGRIIATGLLKAG